MRDRRYGATRVRSRSRSTAPIRSWHHNRRRTLSWSSLSPPAWRQRPRRCARLSWSA